VKINDLSLYSRYAFRDLTRSYSKILSIIITLLISLFILSAILTIEDSLENELNENSNVLVIGCEGNADVKLYKQLLSKGRK